MKEVYTLVFLTVLVRLGLGTLSVFLLIIPFMTKLSESIVAFICLAITAFGLGLSLFHVGKPGRIFNMFSNRESAMSWEAIIAPFMLCIIFAYVLVSYFYESSAFLMPLRILSFLFAIVFIFVTGKVYHLRARPSWNTTLVLYEYFISAVLLGSIGMISMYFFFGLFTAETYNPEIYRILSYIVIVSGIIEIVITHLYRKRAMTLTVTANEALSTKKNKKLYFNFVTIGLILPLIFSIALIFNTQLPYIIPILLICSLIGAAMWRVLFFRSATLIKITPDIKI